MIKISPKPKRVCRGRTCSGVWPKISSLLSLNLSVALALPTSSLLAASTLWPRPAGRSTANLCTKILDFRGFNSSIVLILRGGTPRPVGNFSEILSRNLSREILSGEIGRSKSIAARHSANSSVGWCSGNTTPESEVSLKEYFTTNILTRTSRTPLAAFTSNAYHQKQ